MVEIKNPEEALSKMRLRVQEQGDIVRALKSNSASEAELKMALSELKARKKLLEELEIELMPPVTSFDRAKLEDLLKQKFFYDQSFSIYGGIQGLYDFGPMGCAMKANLLAAWRQHFVLEDQLLEVDCSMLTPAPVLQASGHVDRFTDLMVKDVKTGECFRADHLVKANLESKQKHKKTPEQEKAELQRTLIQLDNLGAAELDALIRKYDMRSPTTGNELTEPQQFNLMFATMIGPTGQCQGYLRPETAQGIFVNFQRLLQFNQGRIPFGAAQIGSAFRNEISPRSGLIRVREFPMAEIEYFVDPANKQHPKFARVKDVEMTIYSSCAQMDGLSAKPMTIGEAVSQGIVANETLGYFMARIHLFLTSIGVDPTRLRFRQHLSNEMAHYACDCWDAECQTSYGWIECVGCADRSCYDLTQHTKATGARLVAEKRLPEPRPVKVCECIPHKQELGKAFRGDAKSIIQQLSSLSLDDALSLKKDLTSKNSAELTVGGKSYTIQSSMVQMKEYETNLHVEEIVPNVIEPSFGIGRILYAIFEHSFRIREGDEQRTYLSVRPILAPYKCSVLPLSTHPDFTPFIEQLSSSLTRLGVTHRVDDSSGSIGRRYARTDQIAIPYGITIDFDTVNKSPASATLRERDSMKQIRVPLTELPALVNDLSNGFVDWSEAQSKYPLFEQQETARRDNETPVAIPAPVEVTEVNNKSKKKKQAKKPKNGPQKKPVQPEAPVKEATQDDWQSVSEELDDMEHKIHRETDLEAWSSAAEAADADGELTSVATQPKPHGTLLNRKGKGTKDGQIRKFSTDTKTDEIRLAPAKKPISWSDWGKAVRRHYHEEELRDKGPEPKPLPTSISLDMDESRSPFSGYEADQEDNAVSKSAAGHLSQMSKEHDTLYEFSPAVESLIDDSIKDRFVPAAPTNEPADLEADFPPLAASKQPYHGLFVGNGWPGEQKKALPVLRREKKPQITEKKGHVEPNVSKTQVDTTGWPSVMAQLLERNCEPEHWYQCLEHPVPNFSLPAVEPAMPKPISKQPPKLVSKPVPKPTVVPQEKVVQAPEFDNSKFHGLFVGAGWPAAKAESNKPKEAAQPKPQTKAQRKRQKSGSKSSVVEELAKQIPEPTPPDSWKSVVAHIYDKLVSPALDTSPCVMADLSGPQQLETSVYEDASPCMAPSGPLEQPVIIPPMPTGLIEPDDRFKSDLEREGTSYTTTSESAPVTETKSPEQALKEANEPSPVVSQVQPSEKITEPSANAPAQNAALGDHENDSAGPASGQSTLNRSKKNKNKRHKKKK